MFRKYVYLHPSVGENKDGMDYEMMTNGAVPVKHQYINVDRRGKRDQQSPNSYETSLISMYLVNMFDTLRFLFEVITFTVAFKGIYCRQSKKFRFCCSLFLFNLRNGVVAGATNVTVFGLIRHYTPR